VKKSACRGAPAYASAYGLEVELVGWGFVGVAPGFVGRRPHEVSAPGDEPKAEPLGFQGFLGQGGPDGQQQPAKQKAPARGFSSVIAFARNTFLREG